MKTGVSERREVNCEATPVALSASRLLAQRAFREAVQPSILETEPNLNSDPEVTRAVDSHRADPGTTPELHQDDEGMPRVLEEELRQISRKPAIRAITRSPETDLTPVVCRIDLIRAAKAMSGYSDTQIAALAGLSRPTVIKALNADPSIKLRDFCAVMSVLGIEIADLFPVRKQSVVNGEPLPSWSRGPHVESNAEQLQRPPNPRPPPKQGKA